MKAFVLAMSMIATMSAYAISVPTGPYARPALEAAKRGDCEAAVAFLNKGIEAKDGEALFWTGRMFDLGTCVTADPVRATRFFSEGDKAGNSDARLELATKYGLGVGVEQSYEHAGQLVRDAGAKDAGSADTYTIGYANTIRGIAQRKMVESIPSDLLRESFSGTIIVQFYPRTRRVSVRPGPQFAMRSDPATGSNLRRGRTDVVHVAEDVWTAAVTRVPAPEAARLQDPPVTMELYIDVKVEPIDPESLTPILMRYPHLKLGGG